MHKIPRLFGLLFLIMLGVAALIISLGESQVQAAPASSVAAQACDPSGSTNGTASPTTIRPGDTITFTVTGFRPGDQVSFWFTTPGGSVFGTPNPFCCAPSSGRMIFVADEEFTSDFGQEPGRWAFTVQGGNQHTAVVYFCVVTQQPQPTNTPVPPTNTAVPPTATSVPPSPTAVPSTPTAGASPTAIIGSPTVAATTPTVAVSPTTAPPSPTTAPPTQLPTQEPTVEPTMTAIPAPTVVGMPRTGQNDSNLFVILALMAFGVLGVGLAARKSSRVGH